MHPNISAGLASAGGPVAPEGSMVAMPFAVMIDKPNDIGITAALDPSDRIVAMTLSSERLSDSDGQVRFQRRYHRLTPGQPSKHTWFLAAHQAE